MSISISDEQHRRIHELTAEGYKTADIAAILGVGETAILKYRKIPCDGEKLDPVQEHRLLLETRQLRRQFNELLEHKALNSRYEDFVLASVERAKTIQIPSWASVVHLDRKRQGIPTLLFSDGHLDETVKAAQVGGVNGFDRPTAILRVRKMFENSIKVCRDMWTGLDYPGFCLAFGGDTFSGIIHEELAASNAATMMQSLLFWAEPISAGIKMLVDEFGKLIIPSTVGNHGRNTKKPIHKNRVTDNFDWLFIEMLRQRFDLDSHYGPRISWIIPHSSDTRYKLLNTTYLLTHGDQFKGGSGIAGALSPMMIGFHRKLKRYQAAGKPFDYMVAAHWHQLMFFKRIIVNGALKGFDEYAHDSNFDYEPPQQALWITDAKHGVTFTAPVHCLCDDEPWRLESADAEWQKVA